MAYSKFTLKDAKEKLGLNLVEDLSLFRQAAITAVEPSEFLQLTLQKYVPLALAVNTEKSRSEWIIAPLLVELKERLNQKISIFSGKKLDVAPERGLDGYCDYIVSLNAEQYYISAPIVTIVEAKKEDLVEALGQCIATMYAAQLFNARENQAISCVYGIVTTGTNWKFIRLEGDTVYIDTEEYYLKDLGLLLGILIFMTIDCCSMAVAG